MADTARTGLEDDERFEALLAECIERYTSDGDAGVDALCTEHPADAQRIRERLSALDRLGILARGDSNGDPEQLGRYRVLRRLGHGGMSLVYLVRDENLERDVALKIGALPGAPGSRSEERFAREARAVSQLEHPCIVPVYDVGQAEGRPFFTMEYVTGVTLDRLLDAIRAEKRSFEELTGSDVERHLGEQATSTTRTYVEVACRIVLDVADALVHAHSHGIVHRDVKPSNVFVRAGGRAQLFDFGLARLADLPALTRTGEFTGTPYYVSPEQLGTRRTPVDERVDVFGLAVTLYEMLALRRPFEGETTAQVFRAILTREPADLARANPLVPRDLATLVHAALEKDPRRRTASVAAFADDLRRFLAFQPVHARPAHAFVRALRYARRSPARAAAFAAAATLVVGLPIGLLWSNAIVRGERDEAARQARLRGETNDFLVGLFQLSGEAGDEARRGAEELLRRGRGELERGVDDQPLVHAALLAANGRAFHELGLDGEAVDLLNRSHALFVKELGPTHPEAAAVLTTLAEVHLGQGSPALAYGIATRALAAHRATEPEPLRETLRCRLTRARAASLLGRSSEARADLEELLAEQHVLGLDADEEAEVCEQLGKLELDLGRHASAHAHLAHALTLRAQQWSPELADLVRTHELLAECAERRGDDAERGRHAWTAARLAEVPDGPPAGPPAPVALVPTKGAAYQAAFQSAISAHLAGDRDGAIAGFEQCLELVPGDGVAAYNIACTYGSARLARETAHWLDEARGRGFGSLPRRHESLFTDPDLDPVRDDSEVGAALDRLAGQYDDVLRFADSPLLLEAPAASSADGLPLLVFLHADGSTKERAADGPWRAAAEAAGLALFVPSGPRGIGARPADGMSWIVDETLFLQDPRGAGDSALQAVHALARDRTLDRERVFLAGEGVGGTLALDLALRAPGLFRGVVLLDSAPHPASGDARARRAAALGLRILVLYRDGQTLPMTDAVAGPELAAATRAWLAETCGFGAAAEVALTGEPRAELSDRLRGFVAR